MVIFEIAETVFIVGLFVLFLGIMLIPLSATYSAIRSGEWLIAIVALSILVFLVAFMLSAIGEQFYGREVFGG